MEEEYRMDRSKVTRQSHEQANDHVSYWETRSVDERLNAACYIINNIYGVTASTKVDRTVVNSRSRNHG